MTTTIQISKEQADLLRHLHPGATFQEALARMLAQFRVASFFETEDRITQIPASTTVFGDKNIRLLNALQGTPIVRLQELILDSAGTNFDFALFERDLRQTQDRIVNILAVNLHTVAIFGAGQGVQYQDRNMGTNSDELPSVYARVTNNGTAPIDVLVRVRYRIVKLS